METCKYKDCPLWNTLNVKKKYMDTFFSVQHASAIYDKNINFLYKPLYKNSYCWRFLHILQNVSWECILYKKKRELRCYGAATTWPSTFFFAIFKYIKLFKNEIFMLGSWNNIATKRNLVVYSTVFKSTKSDFHPLSKCKNCKVTIIAASLTFPCAAEMRTNN